MVNPNKQNIDVRPIVIGAYTLADKKTILQDAGGVIPRGAVLGIITMQTTAASVTVSAITGTGNGTLTKDATTPVLAGAKPGAYTVKCISAGAAAHHAGFEVRDPFGRLVGTFFFTTTGQSYTFSNEIKFAMVEGSTDFAIGDFFTFTIAAGSGKLKRSDPTAVDGSQYPTHIVTDEVDATAADQSNVQCVKRADVREDGLVFTGSETLATAVPLTGKTFRELLEARNIYAIPGSTGSRYNNG